MIEKVDDVNDDVGDVDELGCRRTERYGVGRTSRRQSGELQRRAPIALVTPARPSACTGGDCLRVVGSLSYANG